MAMRVCRHCKEKSEMEDMRKETSTSATGRVTNRYFHHKCWDEMERVRIENEIEQAKLDSLVKTIEELHNGVGVPAQFYPFIQDLRNGNNSYGSRKDKRKKKQGYEYEIIEETYRYVADNILWAIKNKRFKSVLSGMKYTLAIVTSNIELVKRRRIQREQAKARADALAKENSHLIVDVDKVVKPKKRQKKKLETDISDFL